MGGVFLELSTSASAFVHSAEKAKARFLLEDDRVSEAQMWQPEQSSSDNSSDASSSPNSSKGQPAPVAVPVVPSDRPESEPAAREEVPDIARQHRQESVFYRPATLSTKAAYQVLCRYHPKVGSTCCSKQLSFAGQSASNIGL